MANIGSVPSALALLRDESRRNAKYGPHGRVEFDPTTGTVTLVATEHGRPVVVASATDSAVNLGLLNPGLVPYANAFLADHGRKIEKYWRTGAYRITGKADASVLAESVAAVVAPTVEDEEAEEVTPVAVPLTLVTSEPEIEGDIPGVETPTRVKVKSAGKGWSQVGDIVVPDADLQTLRDAWQLRQSGVPSSVLVTGPAGTAKTALVRAFAASIGVPFLKVDGGAIRTADDWAGAFRQDPTTKTWAHRWSPFAQVLRKGEPTVVLIDEFNRTESPQAANALMGLLDWTGTLLVPDANAVLKLPAGVLVVATANIGPEFVGTLPLDGAVRQRFPFGLRLGYPDAAREAKLLSDMTGVDGEIAKRLVTLADMQRVNREDPQQYPSGAVISTRVLLDIARRIQTCATPPRLAVQATLRGQFDPGDETALSIIVDTQFPEPIEEEVIDEEVAAFVDAAKRDLDDVLGSIASDPDPLGVAKAAATPLIVTGKHYFVNRLRTGGLSRFCQYEATPGGPICGEQRLDPIHLS